MAAEIGSMRVYQEIDGSPDVNINPIHYLVLPRMNCHRRCRPCPLLRNFCRPRRLVWRRFCLLR